jgi:hypothetical protein
LGLAEKDMMEHAMRRIGRLPVIVVVLSLVTCGIGNSPALAGEILVNGDLELGVSPPSWSVETSITGIPGSTFPTVFEHNDGGNNPPPPDPGLGISLHPQRGNQFDFEGQDYKVNFVLEQTFGNGMVSATPGRTYSFKGDVMLQDGYSGIVDTLEALHPAADYNDNFETDAADYTTWRDSMTAGLDTLPNRDPAKTNDVDPVDEGDFTYWRDHFGYKGHDAIASPTVTTFEMAFLNASDVVVGDPVVFDLRDDPTTLAWRTHTLVGLAPATTAKVRVRVSALDMIDNCCALGQDVFFDNFSLSDNIVPAANRLTNGDLNTPGEPLGWTLTEGPTVDQGIGPITADSAAFVDNANRKIASDVENPLHNPPNPEFLSVKTGQQGLWLRPFVNTTQFEPDIPEVEAVLSQVVPATEGATYEFSAWSAWEEFYSGGLPFTTTETFMKMEFLNGSMAVIGTEMIDLADEGQVNDDDDDYNTSVGYNDWRQFFVNGTAPELTSFVRVSLGATGMFHSGSDPQSAFFDEMSLIETLPGAGAGLAAAVPEPASVVLLGIAVVLAGAVRRRGQYCISV